MKQLMNTDTKTMSSLELLELVNDCRSRAGESEIENRKFVSKIEDELDEIPADLISAKILPNGTEQRVYTLTLEQCTLVGMRESKSVRRAVLEKLKELERSNPALRSDLITHKRLAQKTWSDALKENREDQGKDTKAYHYSNENLMLNEVVLGERRPFDESEMTDADVQMLEDARVLNGSMIKLDIPYKERKIKLMQWRDKAGKKLMLGDLK